MHRVFGDGRPHTLTRSHLVLGSSVSIFDEIVPRGVAAREASGLPFLPGEEGRRDLDTLELRAATSEC